MAMNGDTLGNAIASAVDGLDLTTSPPPSTSDIWKTIGNVIVDHIVNSAEISVSTTHTTGAISVVGTATAQSNPAPVNSTTGSGQIS